MRRPTVLNHSILVIAVLATVIVVFAQPAIPQPAAYHMMADDRSCIGLPNCLNVLSNLPFAIVGLLGLAATFGLFPSRSSPFSDPWERWPYAALFAGVALTTLGSGYYHLAPDNARLVWDRLPMAIGFMGILTALVGERVSLSLSRRLFIPLLALGATSVAYWYWTELRNMGDLRLYLLVQFGSLLLVVLLLVLYPARYAGTSYLVVGLAAYAIAKYFEVEDRNIFARGQIISGHTLKHLTAAAGVACLVAMLRSRGAAASLPERNSPSAQQKAPATIVP